jgi:DNA-binding transcriptional LysR family regulator
MADVEAFVTIVDKGTISAAAVALGTTPSVLSRAVARLEARLGVQLLRRTTRRLSITEAGNLYLEQARNAFGLIADAERAIQGQGGALSGKVRISVPTTYGHYRLPALLRLPGTAPAGDDRTQHYQPQRRSGRRGLRHGDPAW